VAEEVDLRFLGEQLNHLQDDIQSLKSDMAQVREASARVRTGVSSVRGDVARVETTLEDFRQAVKRRFDRTDDLMKSGFEMLCAKIDAQIELFSARSDQINTISDSVGANSAKRS
jgi:predicted  nucleic acid-binding Zn-ribbon protein